MSRPTLTVALGFNGALELLYPNGKSITLPVGEAEARMVEILEGFRRDLRTIRQERNKNFPTVSELTIADLEKALGL